MCLLLKVKRPMYLLTVTVLLHIGSSAEPLNLPKGLPKKWVFCKLLHQKQKFLSNFSLMGKAGKCDSYVFLLLDLLFDLELQYLK